jgi:hypothetical protein
MHSNAGPRMTCPAWHVLLHDITQLWHSIRVRSDRWRHHQQAGNVLIGATVEWTCALGWSSCNRLHRATSAVASLGMLGSSFENRINQYRYLMRQCSSSRCDGTLWCILSQMWSSENITKSQPASVVGDPLVQVTNDFQVHCHWHAHTRGIQFRTLEFKRNNQFLLL